MSPYDEWKSRTSDDGDSSGVHPIARCACGRHVVARGQCAYCLQGLTCKTQCYRHVGAIGHMAKFVPCCKPAVARIGDLKWPACPFHADEAREQGCSVTAMGDT